MAKLSSYKRIITTDFKKEEQSLVERLAGPINDGLSQLFFNLNGRLNLKDNFAATVRDVDITVDSNGIPVAQTSFTLDREGVVQGCMVISAVNQVNSTTYPTGAPFISFAQLSGSILINHVTGLQANQRYRLRIVAFH